MPRTFPLSLAALAFWIAALVAPLFAQTSFPTNGTVRVFIVAGQSNAEGHDSFAAHVDRYPPYVGAAAPQSSVRFWYETDVAPHSSNGWIAMQPERERRIFGIEMTFARRVAASLPDPVALIKSTRGGTSLAVDWQPGSQAGAQMYQRTLTLVRTALASLTTRNIPWTLEGVLWQQGSNDVLNPRYVAQYGANLAALITRLRTDLGEPTLPFYVGALSDKCIWGVDGARPAVQRLRQQQFSVISADPDVHFVAASHLSFKINTGQKKPHYHYGTEGTLQLGDAYADAYLTSIGRGTPHRSAPLCCGLPPAGSTVRVFVVAGQRSAEGERSHVAQIGNHPAYAALANPRSSVPYRYRLGGGAHTATDWAPLGDANYLGNFGPELSFGQVVDDGLSGPIAMIKVTHSGAIMDDWLPNPTNASVPQYQDAVAFINGALADLRSKGLRPVLDTVVWIPGAHDAWWAPHRDNYATNLRTVVAAMRRDLGAPALKWLVAELADGLIWGSTSLNLLDAQIQSVANADPLVWFVPTGSIAVPASSPTFTTAGTLELGKRLGSFYLSLARTSGYGVGKRGTGGVPTLAASARPVLGTTITLHVTDGNPGDTPQLLFGAASASVAFDGGTLLVSPLGALAMPAFDPAGRSSRALSMPSAPQVSGAVVYFQAMFVDSGPGAFGAWRTAQTQGLKVVLGR